MSFVQTHARSVPSETFAAVAVDTDLLVNGQYPRALFIGSGGSLSARGRNSVDVTFVAVQTGAILPISCTRVNNTGTTASSIVALY